MPATARRVKLDASIDGHSVTDAFAPYLMDFTYTDNAHGKADEVQMTLHNRDGRFTGEWKPKKGMDIRASIQCFDWERDGENLELPCGGFKIDEIEFSGPPDRVQIKAVSSDLTGPLRETRRTRAWENTSLKTVARQLAQENGLEIYYDGPEHKFERQDQRNESDLAFVNRLAMDRDMRCKTHDGRLILFDAEKAEAADAVISIPKKGGMYSPRSYSFKMSSSGTDYTKAQAAYTDPKTGTTHTAEVKSSKKTATRGEKTLTLQKRVENAEQATQLGKSELRKANAREQTANIEIMGCPRIAAGQMIELTGFGDFSGRYFVKSATHKLTGGYTTSLELTTPAPAEGDKVGNEVNEAAKAWHEEQKRKSEIYFTDALDKVRAFGTDIEKLLICLPEIAAHIAEKDMSWEDHLGYVYLSEMLEKWLHGLANMNPFKDPNPYFVSWDWAMKYTWARGEYLDFVSPTLQEGTIYSYKAVNMLGQRLCENGILNPNKQETTFDFINQPWVKYPETYYTYRAINRPMQTDGLMAALGAFTLRALAAGKAKNLGNGKWRITIKKVGIYIQDTFNFAPEFYDWIIGLGVWSCSRLDGGQIVVTGAHSLEYMRIHNSDFREFREKYKIGNNFLVLSQPHIVEDFRQTSYEYTCAK